MNRPPLGYRLASAALALPFGGYTIVRTLRDGGAGYLRERLGLVPECADRPLWIHCASVGEIVAALPLVTELRTHGIGPLLLSTNTPTGRRVAEARAPEGVRCLYLPLDRPAPVRRFLARVRPRAAVVLETELWPWLFAGAMEQELPVVIVNGRLSPRTREAAGWLRAAASWCLQHVAAVLARSEDDADAFRTLGAPAMSVRTVGNLKLAAPGPAGEAEVTLGRRYVLAASTHDDEEAQLARAWCAASSRDAVLVVAPRHPERGAAIADRLGQMGLGVARRSRDEPVTARTDVYLADTLGELPGLIGGAELVIMGGSLIPHGGQNVLEPARAGRAILAGPHMDNFRHETEALAAAGGLRQCADAAEVVAAARELLADAPTRTAMTFLPGLISPSGIVYSRSLAQKPSVSAPMCPTG